MSDGTVLILFLAITAIMAIFPFLMKRFGIPVVISLLIVGMLIGPTGVGIDLIPYISKGLAFLIGADAPDTARTFTIFATTCATTASATRSAPTDAPTRSATRSASSWRTSTSSSASSTSRSSGLRQKRS